MLKSNIIILFDIDYTLFDTDTFRNSQLTTHRIYDEVLLVLEELCLLGDLGILSEGEDTFQRNKMEQTQITRFFQEHCIHIVPNKESVINDILHTYEGKTVVLIDDKLQILYKAKTMMPSLFAIWVKRGKYAASQQPIDGFVPDGEVHDLQDVVPLIQKYIGIN